MFNVLAGQYVKIYKLKDGLIPKLLKEANEMVTLEYHIVLNKRKVALIQHDIGFECDLCKSCLEDDNGIIDLSK